MFSRLQLLKVPLTRSAHTRPKKISVQALKDHGRRFKGEIYSVSEGHMRLKLHPEGMAAYVLKNEPLKLPELKFADAQRMRKEIQMEAKAAVEKQAQIEADSQKTEEVQVDKVKSFLNKFDFPSVNKTAATIESEAGAETASPGKSNAESSSTKKFAWQNDFVSKITEKK